MRRTRRKNHKEKSRRYFRRDCCVKCFNKTLLVACRVFRYRFFRGEQSNITIVGITRVDRYPDVINEDTAEQHEYREYSAGISGCDRSEQENIGKRGRRGGIHPVPHGGIFHGASVLDAEHGVGRKIGQTVRQQAKRYADEYADKRNVIETGENDGNVVVPRRGNYDPAHADKINYVHYERGDKYYLEVPRDVTAISQKSRDYDDRKRNNAKQSDKIELPDVELVMRITR